LPCKIRRHGGPPSHPVPPLPVAKNVLAFRKKSSKIPVVDIFSIAQLIELMRCIITIYTRRLMMERFTWIVAVVVLLFVGVTGCSKKEATAPASQAQPAANMAQADSSLTGKVVETMNSGGYTYVCLENNGQKTWVAVPQTKVAVGQMVTCRPGMEMRNFTSKTLQRTFPSIYFSGGIL
jgi:hypothetical protein